MQHVQEITLDINQHGYVSINAKQGDQNGRFIRIHLTENGKEFKPGDGVSAEFRAIKQDGKSIDNPATIEEGGTILACLTDQALAVAGEVRADISLKDGDAVVSTLNFLIYVEPAPLGKNIPSTNEFGALKQATADASAAAGEARQASSEASTAAGKANTAAGGADTAASRANDAAKLLEGMTVTASEVPAGGKPTAEITKDGDHYKLDLGLVKGDTGPVSSVNGQTGDVVIGGRNLFSIHLSEIGFLADGGGNAVNPFHNFGEKTSGYIPISTGEEMTIQLWATHTAGANFIDYQFFSKTDMSSGVLPKKRVSFTSLPLIYNHLIAITDKAPEGAEFIRVSSRFFDDGRMKIERGNVATDWTPAQEDKADVPEVIIAHQLADRIYEGADLTVRHAEEVGGYSDVWAWVRARCGKADWSGIHVGDYIPVRCTNSTLLHAEVAGIDTYYQFGAPPAGHHIDFICRELWSVRHGMNKVYYNNGTADAHSPWLASDMHLWINSLAGKVPGGQSVGGEPLEEVDYSAEGVWHFLPPELQAAISASAPKSVFVPTRYSAAGLLTDDAASEHQDMGHLWIPSEMEVYGAAVQGNRMHGAGGFIQYPIFANNAKRLKKVGSVATSWYLMSARKGDSTAFAQVSSAGCFNPFSGCVYADGVPVCFRLTA